jgi:hypothetical protein
MNRFIEVPSRFVEFFRGTNDGRLFSTPIETSGLPDRDPAVFRQHLKMIATADDRKTTLIA